ncbi:MAG: hypothetical protein MJY76_04570 [Bacteroidales bacterium]|nr:hypothetical protein [Bacteroidales bacterium]
MDGNNIIKGFSSYLFWDVDTSSIDMEKHSAYMVQRVLELGQLSDWKSLVAYYGLERIVETARNLRTLDPKALSFIATISSTAKESYRCYTQKQSFHNDEIPPC